MKNRELAELLLLHPEDEVFARTTNPEYACRVVAMERGNEPFPSDDNPDNKQIATVIVIDEMDWVFLSEYWTDIVAVKVPKDKKKGKKS